MDETSNDVWNSIEGMCSKQNLPNCIKTILFHAGFDNLFGISALNEQSIAQIEEYVNLNGNGIVENLNCCHADEYKNSIANKIFRFLTGHKKLILMVGEIVAKSIARKNENCETQITEIWNALESFEPILPNVLKQLIKEALKNIQVTDNLNRYQDTIKYFAIYVYLMCKRQCYEVLSSNLSMPAASTVGKISIKM